MLVKQKIKYIQTLGQKKFREEEGLFIAEGPKLVKELLEADAASVKEVYALQDWIEIEKEIVIEERIVEKEVEKLVEVPVEKIVFQKTNLIQFVRDLFSDKTDLSISEQYEIDRRTVKGLRVQYSNKKYMPRTQNVQDMHNVINLEERKKA